MGQSQMECTDVKAQCDRHGHMADTQHSEEQPTEKLDGPIFCGSEKNKENTKTIRYG